MSTKNETSRLKTLKHKNVEILYVDYSHVTRKEGPALFNSLVAELKLRPESSVRLLINTTGAEHDQKQVNDWKAAQPLFNSRILKMAVFGLSPINTIAAAGYRMAARLVSQPDPEKLGRHFGSQDQALEYLAS